MKTEKAIRNRIELNLQKLAELYNSYLILCQIDLLSGEGNELRYKINSLRGEILGLAWVLGEETHKKYLFANKFSV